MVTDEQLAEIEEFAYKYLEKWEIALVVGLPDRSVLDDSDSKEFLAFMKGRLRRKAQFNLNVIQLSDQLSSPAQGIEKKMAENIYQNDKKKL